MPSRRQHSRKQSGRNYIRRHALENTIEVYSAVSSCILYFKIHLPHASLLTCRYPCFKLVGSFEAKLVFEESD